VQPLQLFIIVAAFQKFTQGNLNELSASQIREPLYRDQAVDAILVCRDPADS
jgi:hypothetical protein